ncbi:hypothetical protein [Chlorogloeopsis sp. ULAP02]|uniref:hypothetical protein n=1 Tax=Chlorogloeopsis sp. ULAP02 TaxID=3107926 RepID=UPI00398AD658
MALEVDLILGARLAGAVKPELQEQTISWIADLKIPEILKVELLGKTKSEAAISFLERVLKSEERYIRAIVAYELWAKGEIDEQPDTELLNEAEYYERCSERAALALAEIGGNSPSLPHV